jgi:hypothetical protein
MILAFIREMNTYTLQFETPTGLSGFLKTSGAQCSEFDVQKLVISCQLTDAQIELATSAYDASILMSDAPF